MMHDLVYLDHNATTPVRAEARAAMLAALEQHGNPSSIHRAGQAARSRLTEARRIVGTAIGLPPDGRLVFTSGGTEANAAALSGPGRLVIRSAIEHDSVRAAVPAAKIVPVTADGCVDLGALERLLANTDQPALVSVMAANNETGVLQPIGEVVRIAHAHHALVHCDAIQAVGKIPFDMVGLGIDLVSISGHKLGGPPGIGGLALVPGVELIASQRGGGQEAGLRAGTENLPGALAFAAAIERATDELPAYARLGRLRDRLEAALRTLDEAVTVIGGSSPRLPNTSCVALPGLAAETQVIALDLAGICVSAGAACSSGKVTASHVLEAMGVARDVAGSAIRISLGRDTNADDIDRCVAAWREMAARAAKRRCAA
jgi:cysteine desulfurase